MSEHGWADFHDDGSQHDDGSPHHDAHDDLAQHDEAPDDLAQHDDGYFDVHHDDPLPEHDVPPAHDLPAADEPDAWEHGHDPAADHEPDADHGLDADPHELHTVGADPDALPEPADAGTEFPPALDVGPLPEPVDGFPWIDTGSLGLIDPATVHAAANTEVNPEDLAAYAGTELPPGVDPWAALADSDDPATSALAKWWSEQQQ